MLDTAVNYENEEEVGEAIRRSGVPREELRLASKIPGRHHGYDDAIASTKESLKRLGVDYLDLHLIHWPNPSVDRYAEAWRALVDLREQGLVRSIGVSNFTEAHLDRIIDETGVTPVVNQVELHPYFNQQAMRDGPRAAGHPHRGVEPDGQAAGALRRAAGRRGRRAARRHARSGDPALARAARLARDPEVGDAASGSAQNLDVFGFELTDEEMAAISLTRPARTAGCSAGTPTPTRRCSRPSGWSSPASGWSSLSRPIQSDLDKLDQPMIARTSTTVGRHLSCCEATSRRGRGGRRGCRASRLRSER